MSAIHSTSMRTPRPARGAAATWARVLCGTLVLAAALALALVATPRAHADAFGVDASGSFSASLGGTQAGGPGDLNVSFALNQTDPGDPNSAPIGTIRNLVTELPAGVIANPTSVAPCGIAQVIDIANRCPLTSAVGTIGYQIMLPTTGKLMPLTFHAPIYRIETQGDETAAFAFVVFNTYPVRLSATVDPSNGYRIKTTIQNTQAGLPLASANVTFWGVPQEHQAPGSIVQGGGAVYGAPLPANVARHRFMSVPTRCSGDPFETTLTLTPWQTTMATAVATDAVPSSTVTGCDKLVFRPELAVTPSVATAAAPAGYRVDLTVPQVDDAYRLNTPNLKDAVVTMPAGVAISPSSAAGLASCTDAQLAIDAKADATCPAASKIGDVTIDSPLVSDQLRGAIYVGQQLSTDPASGQMFRIFLTARAPGVTIKLRGAIAADPSTGRLTASFLDNPQLPFSKMSLTFKDGPRAPLSNPASCGTASAQSTFTAWSGQTVETSSPMTIDRGCDAAAAFHPSMVSGVVNPVAGASSPFVLRISRPDGQRELGAINGSLPAGLLGVLKSVPLCSAAQGAAGTCGSASRVGKVRVAVGPGTDPLWLPAAGQPEDAVYLTEPFRAGDVAGLSIVVPAVAGPYDLGTVVTKVYLKLRPEDQGIDMQSDRLLRIVGGVPVKIREIVVSIDRKGFMVNPTSCRSTALYGNVFSQSWAKVPASSRFQVGGCASLAFSPIIAAQAGGKGNVKRYEHPALKVTVRQPAGQAHLSKANVVLPKELNIDLKAPALKAACPRDVYAKDECSPVATVGTVNAVTPLLREPLTGPAFLIQKKGKLPDLVMRLRNDRMSLDLIGVLDFLRDGRLITRVKGIPDAALSSFVLHIKGGKDGSLLNRSDLCAHKRLTKATFKGQNGKLSRKSPVTHIAGCAKAKAKAKRSAAAASRRAARAATARASAAGGAHASQVRSRAAGGRS